MLSSFIDWSEYRLAGLLFHELTHQRIFVDGDTTFNESLASAVQQAGTALWLSDRQQQAELAVYSRWLTYRAEVITLIVATRNQLAKLYASDLGIDDVRFRKAQQLDDARKAHATIAARHGIENGFTAWFAGELNNASLGSVAAYNSRVPAFLNMLNSQASDFAGFYRYVEGIAGLDKQQRELCLDAWEDNPHAAATVCLTGGA